MTAILRITEYEVQFLNKAKGDRTEEMEKRVIPFSCQAQQQQ